MAAGDLPGHRRPPVVTHQVEAVTPELVGDGQHVVDQVGHGVGPDVGGPGPRRVAPLIGSYGPVAGLAESVELVAPRPRALGEPVQQQDQLTVLGTGGTGHERVGADQQLDGLDGHCRRPYPPAP